MYIYEYTHHGFKNRPILIHIGNII